MRATALSGGEIAGPALAGVLIAVVGPGWALAVDAATFALSALFLVAACGCPARVSRGGEFVHRRPARGLGHVPLADLGVDVRARVDDRQHAVGRVERRSARSSPSRSLGGAAAWGSVLAAMGVGALLGGLLAVRAAPRRPLVLGRAHLRAVRRPARVPRRGRAGRGARVRRAARRRGDDARQRALGVDADAPRPGRVALARERLRLVRLARVPAARARDLGADRGADRHLGVALGGAALTLRDDAVAALRARDPRTCASLSRRSPSGLHANMCSCRTSSSTPTPPSPSWTARPRPRSSRRRRWRLGHEAMAVTDHNGVSGSMEFAQAAQAAGPAGDPRRRDRPRRTSGTSRCSSRTRRAGATCAGSSRAPTCTIAIRASRRRRCRSRRWRSTPAASSA